MGNQGKFAILCVYVYIYMYFFKSTRTCARSRSLASILCSSGKGLRYARGGWDSRLVRAIKIGAALVLVCGAYRYTDLIGDHPISSTTSTYPSVIGF